MSEPNKGNGGSAEEVTHVSPVIEDASARLDAVRGVLSAFDWERDDRQYALEEIERIASAPRHSTTATENTEPGTTVTVISFGYGHGAPPEAHATFDVRHHFKDPHVNPSLRYLTAADAPVVEAVLSTPGIPALIESVTAMARAFRSAPRPGPVTIAVGCVGGRHRSAVIAAEAARRMAIAGIPVMVSHRDITRPVIERIVTAGDGGYASFAERTYTHPDVFTLGVAEGWAEAETDPARIDWPARQARAAIPFEVVGGRPVNPCEKTGIRHGRNEMGFWGEQQMADALVTVTCSGTRYLLMVERGDGYGWAVPGGHAGPGETGTQAAIRELAEETGLTVAPGACRALPPRYVPDPRASDEAWAVTTPVHIDLGMRCALPGVTGGDDARRAAWVPAVSSSCLTAELAVRHGGRVFAAHAAMLGDFLGEVA